jgi:hypothetical protein
VDIVILQNPFNHLKRASDVEAMRDGWDPHKAYGYNPVDVRGCWGGGRVGAMSDGWDPQRAYGYNHVDVRGCWGGAGLGGRVRATTMSSGSGDRVRATTMSDVSFGWG